MCLTRETRRFDVVLMFMVLWEKSELHSYRPIFSICVMRPMVADAFLGFNCSLFSYGPTGSGGFAVICDETCTNDNDVISRQNSHVNW